MADKYLSARDRDMRLNGTICLWDGKPVYVFGGSRNEEEVTITDLDKTGYRGQVVKYTDDRFSDRAFRLGYINYEGMAYFLSRVPTRNQHQGLSHSAVISEPTAPRGYFTSKAMEDCILGNYKSLEEGYQQIRRGAILGHAFSRCLAVQLMDRDRLFLKYRGRTIGWQKDKDKLSFSVFPSLDNRLLGALLKEHNVQYTIE